MSRPLKIASVVLSVASIAVFVMLVVLAILRAPYRFEESEARDAVMRIVLPASFELSKDLQAEVGALLESAGFKPALLVHYASQDVRSKRVGFGEYRVWLAVSLGEPCIGTVGTRNLLDREPGRSGEELEARPLAECKRQRAVLDPLWSGWHMSGCEEDAEFLVTLGEPPTVVPQNSCAQVLYEFANR